MAILSKIRERSVYLILIIGLALLAFVIDPSQIQGFFGSEGTNEIGKINGEEISRQEFAEMMENYQSRAGGKMTQIQAANVVWNGILNEKIFEEQLQKSGVVVGEKDIWEAILEMPSIQQAELFKNEAGLFSEEKLKEYVSNLKAEYDAGRTEGWLNWLQTEKGVKTQLQQSAYTSLVSQGIGVSVKEGEYDYKLNNTKIDAQYVYIPYTSVADSLAKVSNNDIKAYVKKHPKNYKKEASRSLKFVSLAIIPSQEDEDALKKEVANFIEDKEEYNSAIKSKVTIKGFKNATDLKSYLDENGSDVSYESPYFSEKELPEIEGINWEEVKINDVVGPYKNKEEDFRISKITDIAKIPDSVQSSHIIVPFAGATRATTTVTKEQAKKQIDSLFSIISKDSKQFEIIADKINTDATKGKGGSIGWVVRKNAFSPFFDENFANYIFKNKKGSTGIVETGFGYHIIRIDDQKNFEDVVQLVSFGRSIEASETTENSIFERAETLAYKLSEGEDIDEVSKVEGYFVQSAENLKVLDENVPGIGNQRQIVSWAFNKDTQLGDSRRFDIEHQGKRGYVVAKLVSKVGKDEVAITGNILNNVRPILLKSKKAQIIKDKMSGTSLEEIAKNNGTSVESISGVTFSSPLISGVGNEPKVVGVMSGIPIDKTSKVIEGEKGVFIVKVLKRTEPEALDSYKSYQEDKKKKIEGRMYQLYDVLKEKAKIVDERATFF